MFAATVETAGIYTAWGMRVGGMLASQKDGVGSGSGPITMNVAIFFHGAKRCVLFVSDSPLPGR